MAEQVTFDAPVDPSRTVFRIALLTLDWQNAHIKIHLRDWNGSAFGERTLVVHYTGDEARALMTTLNKANLSTQSLHQRVINRLRTDGRIPAGTPSGNPD